MNDIVMLVEGLSKRYRIGQRRHPRQLREALVDTFYAPLRRFHSMAQEPSPDGDGRGANPNGWIWALKDISFNLKQGEVLGIIGRNGAGKSTLLKILSRITKPTEGYAEIHGRVGTLLEVGTGFHPELTGRENIYLNGAILGMKRYEINRKFDEIVAFAEIDKFIDTPVKHYSSGMYVRLAFAVAAHLEREILIVDEVLAVGDVQFQKKCLGKMKDISGSKGRTVLFVSHNMDAVQRLCSRCLVLGGGRSIEYGNTATSIARYLSSDSCKAEPGQWIDVATANRTGTGQARFVSVRYSSLNPATEFRPYSNGPLEFLLAILSDSQRSIGSVAVTLYDLSGAKLVNADSISQGRSITLREGLNYVRLRIKKLNLNPGVYRVGLWLANPIDDPGVYGLGLRVADPVPANLSGSWLDHVQSAFDIEVMAQESQLQRLGTRPTYDGVVTCEIELLEVVEDGQRC